MKEETSQKRMNSRSNNLIVFCLLRDKGTKNHLDKEYLNGFN